MYSQLMSGFDLRTVFASISAQLVADFERTAQIAHLGGRGTAREDGIRNFLDKYLPRRYTLGHGEVLHSTNRRSRQCDLIIYDADRCPLLLVDSHSVYPLESVFGTIEVKSVLTSEELDRAFENVASVKRLASEGTISIGGPGFDYSVPRPTPIGVIIAYKSNRTLQAILDQYVALEKASASPRLSPDIVVVLGEGVISRPELRANYNKIDPTVLANPPILRLAKKHTLLRFYLELLQQLNSLYPEELDLGRYLRMPRLVGEHRFRIVNDFTQSDFFQYAEDGSVLRALRFTDSGVNKILAYCQDRAAVTFEQFVLASTGAAPSRLPALVTKRLVKVFNPYNRMMLAENVLGIVEIDGEWYLVDLGAFDETVDVEEDPDPDLSEVFMSTPSGIVRRRW